MLQKNWSVIESNFPGRASASVTSHKNSLWLFGGISFDMGNDDLFEIDIVSQHWKKVVLNGSAPASRYEHSSVLWNESLLVFGGKLVKNEKTVDEMWRYDLIQSSWSKVEYISDFGYSLHLGSNWNLKLAGHSANLIQFENKTSIMIVLFGYHPSMSFSPLVYEYNPSEQKWILPHVNDGALVRGLFGHTTVYDVMTQMLFIHGGMQSGAHVDSNSHLTDQTISYHPVKRRFQMLASSGLPRYLHSAVIFNGVMFVYGGSAQNETSDNKKCFSSDFLAYSMMLDRYVCTWMMTEKFFS